MAKVKITQTKGYMRCLPAQRAGLEALGLRRINASVEKEINPAIKGILRRVEHLVKVEEI